jgi:hypothetical protein
MFRFTRLQYCSTATQLALQSLRTDAACLQRAVGPPVILMASSAAAVGVCIVRWAALHDMRALPLPGLTRQHQPHGSGDGLTAADLFASSCGAPMFWYVLGSCRHVFNMCLSHLLFIGMDTCQSMRSSWQGCCYGVNGQHSCAHVRALTSVSQVHVVQCSSLFGYNMLYKLIRQLCFNVPACLSDGHVYACICSAGVLVMAAALLQHCR